MFTAGHLGKVGYSVNCEWPLPEDSSSQEDVIAVETDYNWFINGFLHPIFSSDGDYLPIMKERIANYSRVQGFARSRLPSFTKEQIRYVRGSADFLGINYYTYEIIKAINTSGITDVSYVHDVGINATEEARPEVEIYFSLLCVSFSYTAKNFVLNLTYLICPNLSNYFY